METINVASVVRNGFPDEEGKRLAGRIDCSPRHLKFDIFCLPAKFLVSNFFANFFNSLYDRNSDWGDYIPDFEWEVMHEFQRENIARWAAPYDPSTHCITRGIRQIEKPDHISVGLPPGNEVPTLFVTTNGNTHGIPLTNELAEVLIAEGYSYQG